MKRQHRDFESPAAFLENLCQLESASTAHDTLFTNHATLD